jgi:hypothetical protein
MTSLDTYVDWADCELVERIPDKVSGRPIVRGTRILADTIVQDAELWFSAGRNPREFRLTPFSSSFRLLAPTVYIACRESTES